MDLTLNTTIYTEMMDVISMPFQWMNRLETSFFDYPPCLNVYSNESFYLYGVILLIKNLVLLHGMVQILPKWIPLICFPILLVFNHYHAISAEQIACVFAKLNIGFILVMVWQFVLNVSAIYAFFAYVLLLAEFVLDSYHYVGLQMTVDMFIVLIEIWNVVNLWVNKRYFTVCLMTLLVFCGISVGFYLFLISVLILCSWHNGLYALVFGNQDDQVIINVTFVGTQAVMICKALAHAYGF